LHRPGAVCAAVAVPGVQSNPLSSGHDSLQLSSRRKAPASLLFHRAGLSNLVPHGSYSKCAHHAKRVPLHTTPVEPPCPFVAGRLEARMSTCATHVPLHPALTRNVHIHAQRSLSIKTPRATRKRQKSHKTGARALVCLAAPLPPKCPVHGRHTPVQAVPRRNHHCQSGAAPLASLRSIHYDRCPSLASRSTPSPRPPSFLCSTLRRGHLGEVVDTARSGPPAGDNPGFTTASLLQCPPRLVTSLCPGPKGALGVT